MRITIDLDDDVFDAARRLAADSGRSIGSVISDVARRGMPLARVDKEGDLPVIRVPAGTPAITPQMVRRAHEGD